MNMRLIGLALGLGLMSLSAQAQVLSALDNPGQQAGGNQIPGVTGTTSGLSPADLAAFSGPAVSHNSGTNTGGLVGIVDGKGFAGGTNGGTVGDGSGSPPPPVPEPQTYAMLIAGLSAISIFARRRKLYP